MKYLPRDVSSFQRIIEDGYLYVDKTEYIYNLYTQKDRYHFLSRPRRFGKSLLISTLKELFSAKRILFKDLWIDKSNYLWKNYPIIDLDFSVIAHRTPEMLEISLRDRLDEIATHYEVKLEKKQTLEDQLKVLIKALAQIDKVVLLVDEYDQPLLSHLNNLDIAYANRTLLRSFYQGVKGHDKYMQAIFITGVSKFSKTSIFSGINNLNDISMSLQGSQLCGYTQKEIVRYFEPYIAAFAKAKNRTIQEIMEEMKEWYDGYRFSEEDTERIYNPYSVTYYLKDQKRLNYWFESATPTFLVQLMKKQYDALDDLQHTELSRNSLGTFDIEDIPVITVLFQTGYLTIKEYNPKTERFTLSYPNAEVRESFTTYLVSALARTNVVAVEQATGKLIKALDNEDIQDFCSILQTLFAHIPYNLHIDQEKYYHSLFQFLGTLLGIQTDSEVLTDKGRIDLILTTKKIVYIFEIKVHQTADTALEQIIERRYYERYQMQGKKIKLVGIVFNRSDERLTLDCASKDM